MGQVTAMTTDASASYAVRPASITARHVPVFMLAVLVLVFLLTYAYEFYAEDEFLAFLGVGGAAESTREHWRYVLSVTAFTALAMLAPGWALRRTLARHDRMEAEIRRLATHDGLTGLPNRSLFMDRLEQAIRRAQRSGTNVAVIFLDLDNFKAINDSKGHRRGDAVLRLMADRLSGSVRQTDTVARFGGDEFVIVMTDVTDRQDVTALAEKLNQALSQPCPFEGFDVSVQVSIGIALYPDHADELEALLTLADDAMYRTKGHGKGGYRFSDGE